LRERAVAVRQQELALKKKSPRKKNTTRRRK
jgi:hypothetical protein